MVQLLRLFSVDVYEKRLFLRAFISGWILHGHQSSEGLSFDPRSFENSPSGKQT